MEAVAWCVLGFMWGVVAMQVRHEHAEARRKRIEAYIDGERQDWR